MPVLENDYLYLESNTTDAGLRYFYLKPTYYTKGLAQVTDFNNLDAYDKIQISGGDYYILSYLGIEYDVSNLSWTVELTTENSKNLYGNFDTYGATDVDVLRFTTETPVQLTDERQVISQEIVYFFTLDGKGVYKKVKLTLDVNPTTENIIQSVKILNFNTVQPITGTNLESDTYYYGANNLGFNYTSLAAYNAEWVTDAGLTAAISKSTTYPNLLPAFSSSEWQNLATVINDSTLDLKAGDAMYICTQNAFPERKHWLIFEVQNLTGPLKVDFVIGRDARTIDTHTNLQSSTITENGGYVLECPLSYGANWCYVRFNQISGASRIYQASVNYRGLDYTYAAPATNQVSNFNMRNCIRITSANPNGKYITRTLGSNIEVGDGKGVLLGLLPLDNNPITDGALKIGFQKPDNSWVSTGEFNIFVDYTDKYNATATQFNLWSGTMLGASLPDGVDEIKAIRLEFTTTETIDWLLDYLVVLNWQTYDNGEGSDDRRDFGLSAWNTRAREFHLRGCHGLVYQNNNQILGERVLINTGEFLPYTGTSKLTFSNASSLDDVYLLLDGTYGIAVSGITDTGYEGVIDLSPISNIVYPISVTNQRSGDEYRIKSFDGSSITIYLENADKDQGDFLVIQYKYKFSFPGSSYSLGVGGIVTWQPVLYPYIQDAIYADYTVPSRADDALGMIHGSSNKSQSTMRCYRIDMQESPPLLACYDNAVFSPINNSIGDALFVYYPVKESPGDSVYTDTQTVQDNLENILALSRAEPLAPTPKNYNFIPHIAFGGEQIASDPTAYLIQTRQKFDLANCDNAILTAGSLSWFYDRDIENWWEWGSALADTGIDYLSNGRKMLRRGLSETDVAANINSHRYFFEVTVFAYEHNKRHQNQAAVDYQGVEQYKRVWYYQESGGLYLVKIHAWDDLQDSYYDDIIHTDGNTYSFSYHYTLVIPAFWSVTTPSTDWALDEDTIYDKTLRRVGYLCDQYDTEGIVLSELIHYQLSFADNDFILFDAWCVANGYGTQSDWPRFHSNNYADPDSQLVWLWKRAQVVDWLTAVASVVHGKNKLLGVNVLAQNMFAITNQNNPVWSGYRLEYYAPQDAESQGFVPDTLAYSLDRYGTNYAELLKENVVDILYVWLYHKYGPYGKQAILDFMDEFSAYKDRMIIGIGLFPFDDPPKKCEIVDLVTMLLAGGWQVAYSGYPPTMIQSSGYADVWAKFSGFVPKVTYDSDLNQIKINPARCTEIPFYTRF